MVRPQLNAIQPKVQSDAQTKGVTELTGSGKVTNCYSLHVRNGGHYTKKVVGYLQRNDKVTITGRDTSTGWYRIAWKGSNGFCNSKYINAQTEAVAKKEESPKPPEPVYDLDYLRNENRTLSGTIKITPDFTLMPRDIVTFNGKGLPSILHGDYYVSEVSVEISQNNGITMGATVQKNAFSTKK